MLNNFLMKVTSAAFGMEYKEKLNKNIESHFDITDSFSHTCD